MLISLVKKLLSIQGESHEESKDLIKDIEELSKPGLEARVVVGSHLGLTWVSLQGGDEGSEGAGDKGDERSEGRRTQRPGLVQRCTITES